MEWLGQMQRWGGLDYDQIWKKKMGRENGNLISLMIFELLKQKGEKITTTMRACGKEGRKEGRKKERKEGRKEGRKEAQRRRKLQTMIVVIRDVKKLTYNGNPSQTHAN